MLNFRLLYGILDTRHIKSYLGFLGCLGFGVLLDVVIFLKLAVLIGPWITMAVLAFLSTVGVIVIYQLVDRRSRQLFESVNSGHFDEDFFTRYISALLASPFLVVPGLVNTVFGIILLFPPVMNRIGEMVVRTTGIDWTEAYEHLRLNIVADSGDSPFAISE